ARDQDLRPAGGVAELDLPASKRGRPEGRARRVRHRPAKRVRPEESVMAGIDYAERIPNNVNLIENRRLQRALEEWQPKFLEWWRDMGPHGFQANAGTLRHGVSVESRGWAQFGCVTMTAYRCWFFLPEPSPDPRVALAVHSSEPVWQAGAG